MSNARPSNIFNLCRFTFANCRMCGLPAHPKGDGLCLTHLRLTKAQAKPREDDLSAELGSPDGDYITQIDINHVLEDRGQTGSFRAGTSTPAGQTRAGRGPRELR